MRDKKGVIWISAVIYVMIVVVVMVIVLEAGLPLIKGLNERNAFNRIRDTVVSLDKQIQQIASEGQGSQRVIPIEITDGEFSIKDQRLRWKLETETKIVESKSRVQLGNLIIASDVDVQSKEVGGFFIVENSRLSINFSKIGSPTSHVPINTSDIINSLYYKDNNVVAGGTFTFYVNDSSSISGTGYTKMEDIGTGLTTATLRAHVNNTAMKYDLVITLDSKADFFRANIENFKKK